MIERLVEALADCAWDALSEQAKTKLRLCLIANASVAVAGWPHCRLPKPDPGEGPMLFGGGTTPRSRDAAFFNAAVMHARTQDDFHPLGNLHVGTVVIPALLAECQVRPASAHAFLDALTVGYATAVALSRSFSARTTPKGLRSTGLYSPFGAAAAVARYRGLERHGTASAFALTASMAAGLTQCWIDGSDEWQLHVAAAASNAMLAVDLAEAGVRGGEHALDGQAGFFSALTGHVPTFSEIAADLDADRAIVETVIKRYPVSGICQPVVRLAERIAGAERIEPSSIRSIVIEMNPFERAYPGTLNKGPFRSFSDVLMSAAFCCASVLAQGRLDFDDLLTRERPERDRLIAATGVIEGADLPTLSCRIILSLADGTTRAHALLHGGGELAIDATTVDPWAEALWREGGSSAAAYRTFRQTVDQLERLPTAELLGRLADAAPTRAAPG